MNEALKFLLTLISMILLLSLLIKGSRLLKKKSHHYVVPPDPEKDKDWYPMEFSDYMLFIFIKGANCGDVKNEILGWYKPEISAEIIRNCLHERDTSVLNVRNTGYSDFKKMFRNLTTGFCQTIGVNNLTGFCKHKQNSNKDYIFKLEEEWGKHCIGTFRDGQNFGIYLPKAKLNEKGNISLSIHKEIDFETEVSSLPLRFLDEIVNK